MIYKIITLYCFVVLVSQSLLYAETCSETIPQGQTETCNAITQYGITWTLAENEAVGQFITGDYFIVHDGDVIINSVSPPNIDNVNGTMVNPVGTPIYYQGFVSAAYYANSALNVDFPLVAQTNQSILSTIGQSGAGVAWTGLTEDDSKISTLAVLTILDTQPAAGSFRPGYCGTTKKIYNVSQINRSVLKSLSTADITLPSHGGFTTVGYYERGLQRPWLLIGHDYLGRELHPIQNMLDYHQHIGLFLQDAMLLMHTDLRSDALLYGFIQVGIDYYSMATTASGGDSALFGQVVALTAALMGDSAMLSAYHQPGIVKSISRERQNFYRGAGWTGATALFQKDGNKYEEKPVATWVGNPDCKDESYRDSEDSWPQVGLSLAVMLSGKSAVNALNYNVILDYADRYMTEPFSSEFLPTVQAQCVGYTFGGYQSSGSSFVNSMWAKYRPTVENFSARRLFRNIRVSEVEP